MGLREIFSSIADAIRGKGVSGSMKPAEMAGKIASISTAGPEVLAEKYRNSGTTLQHPTLGALPIYSAVGDADAFSTDDSPVYRGRLVVPETGTIRHGAYTLAAAIYNETSQSFGAFGYSFVPGTRDVSVGAPANRGRSVWLANGFTIKGDANLVPSNIVTGKTVFNVVGSAPVPSGNVDITTTAQVNVANYATARVVDANLKPENIVVGKTILGVSGSASTGGGSQLTGYTVTSHYGDGGYASAGIRLLLADGSIVFRSQDMGTTVEHHNVLAFIAETSNGMGYDGESGRACGLLTGDVSVELSTMCLLRGTAISLANGASKPIEYVTYDDELLVWDFDAGRRSSARPFWIKRAERTDHYWVNTFASGRVVLTTGTVAGHRFFDMETGRFEYNTRCVGHRIATQDGRDVLVSVEHVQGPCEFYNLNTERHINCYANGVLASCRLNNLYPVVDMRFDRRDASGDRHVRDEFPGVPCSWVSGGRFLEQPLPADELIAYAKEREVIRACS